MVEFPQSVPNLTLASQNLYELIKARGIVVYRDADIRLAMQRAIAVETTRGWRIAKDKASHKIDIVVALGMAALGAVRQGQRDEPYETGLPIVISVDSDVQWLNDEFLDTPATAMWRSQQRL
jgi:phage terminase large subunit-like protein